MTRLLVIATIVFLSSCESSSDSTDDEIDIDGRWTVCKEITPTDITFSETIYSNNNSKYEATLFGSMDNQCINVNPNPVIKTNATLVLDKPHLSSSGLMVFEYSLIDVNQWDNVSNMTVPKPNFYTILFLDGEKLYTGKLTATVDGSSVTKRPDEIDFSAHLVKQ